MVENIISYFEDLSFSMDRKKPSFMRSGSYRGRVKKLVNDFTEIKRPSGKSRTIVNNSERGRTVLRSSRVAQDEVLTTHSKVTKQSSSTNQKYEDNSERSWTLPRSSKVIQDEFSTTHSKVTKETNSQKEEHERKKVVEKEKETDSDGVIYNDEREVKKQVEEFAEKLRQKRMEQQNSFDENQITTEVNNDEQNASRTRVEFQKPDDDQEKLITAQEVIEPYSDNMFKVSCENMYNFLDESDSDDFFGSNNFDEDCNDNYIYEAYNTEGKELIITSIEITHRSVSITDEGNNFKNLLEESDFVIWKDYETSDLNNETKLSDLSDSRESCDDDYEPQYASYKVCESIHTDDESDEVFKEINCQSSTNDLKNKIYKNEPQSSDGELDEETQYANKHVKSNEKSSEMNNNDDSNRTVSNFEEQIEPLLNARPSRRYFYINRREEGDNFYHSFADSSDNEFTNQEGSVAYIVPDCNADTEVLNRKDKISYVIDEMINTEELYIRSLQIVVEKYLPYLYKHTSANLIGKTSYVFGNIERIYEKAQKFLVLLKQNEDDADGTAQAFIQSASIFDLYPQYSKNKPTADHYLKAFDEVVKRRQRQLQDKLGLASHLLTPIQRLGKYLLLLEHIQKELNKSGKSVDNVNRAIEVIRRVMRKGNDSIAIDSIKNCDLNLTLQGSFIMRASFNILKPRKFTSMVFLFEKIIVFTQKVAKNMEQFNYMDSIQMSDLSLAKFEEKPCVFHLMDYPKSKRANHEAVTYVLEAESPKIKNDWTRVIEAKLWSQLQKAKEKQKQMNSDEGKRLSKISLPQSPLLRRHSSRGNKAIKPKSTFYDI